MRNISNHLRNEAFKPNVLLLYCDKPLVHLRSLDRNFKGGSGGRNDGEKFDRKASNFNPKQQKGMPVSRQAYKEPGFGKMMEPETSTVEEISYKHYKIYQGKMTFEISKKKKKSLDGVIPTTYPLDRSDKLLQLRRHREVQPDPEKSQFEDKRITKRFRQVHLLSHQPAKKILPPNRYSFLLTTRVGKLLQRA